MIHGHYSICDSHSFSSRHYCKQRFCLQLTLIFMWYPFHFLTLESGLHCVKFYWLSWARHIEWRHPHTSVSFYCRRNSSVRLIWEVLQLKEPSCSSQRLFFCILYGKMYFLLLLLYNATQSSSTDFAVECSAGTVPYSIFTEQYHCFHFSVQYCRVLYSAAKWDAVQLYCTVKGCKVLYGLVWGYHVFSLLFRNMYW